MIVSRETIMINSVIDSKTVKYELFLLTKYMQNATLRELILAREFLFSLKVKND